MSSFLSKIVPGWKFQHAQIESLQRRITAAEFELASLRRYFRLAGVRPTLAGPDDATTPDQSSPPPHISRWRPRQH
jgi:hypothetical protein